MSKTSDSKNVKPVVENRSFLYKIYLFFRQIWRYVIMLPFALLEALVERLALTFESSLSFRIAVTYTTLIIFLFAGFFVFLYYGIMGMFTADRIGTIVITKAQFKELVFWLVLAVSVIVLIMIYLGKMLSDKLISPVKKMADDVKKISSKDMSLRLDEEKAKDELRDLAQYFNSMMDEIQDSYDRKTQFVSDASHELRTPLSVISGYSNMLNRWGKTDPEILDESINVLISESKNMQNLVEKLLFLARSDKGTLKVEKGIVDLNDLVLEVFKEMELIVSDRRFEVDLSESDTPILANYDMIKQLIRIFIDNAIKFTDSNGLVRLVVTSENDFVGFKVIDDGIGIPKEDLPKIFDRFYRADKARASDRGGTGLGLSIAKLIIVAHGGKIHIASDEDNGTQISVRFAIAEIDS